MQKSRKSTGKKPRNQKKRTTKKKGRRGTHGGGRKQLAVHFSSPAGLQLPVPQQFWTKFVAAGSFYTGSGAGTGDYNLNFNANSPYFPFAAVTSGVTWNGITVASFSATGYGTLMKSTYYTLALTYASLFEINITPQSVTDSVICVVTPSLISGSPGNVGVAAGKPWSKVQNFSSGRVNRLGDYPFKHHVHWPTYFGISPREFENDTSGFYVGSYNSNPSLNFPWVVNIETGDNAVLSNPLEISVRITYWTKCYGLSNENFLGEEKDAHLDVQRYYYTPNGRIPMPDGTQTEEYRKIRPRWADDFKSEPLNTDTNIIDRAQQERELDRAYYVSRPKVTELTVDDIALARAMAEVVLVDPVNQVSKPTCFTG